MCALSPNRLNNSFNMLKPMQPDTYCIKSVYKASVHCIQYSKQILL